MKLREYDHEAKVIGNAITQLSRMAIHPAKP
jgi:hypothetical protein